MSNTLKAKTLSKISTVEGNLSGLSMALEYWDEENFKDQKRQLIDNLKQLSLDAKTVKEDVLDCLMKK